MELQPRATMHVVFSTEIFRKNASQPVMGFSKTRVCYSKWRVKCTIPKCGLYRPPPLKDILLGVCAIYSKARVKACENRPRPRAHQTN